ncbi:MAG: hypothetical protein KUL86_06630 [Castellaniella sp.]|nr:hypothetical protein [Castellaniella sp.]
MSVKKAFTAPFASLLGRARAEENEDDERKQRPDESDEDYAKRVKSAEDDDDDDLDVEETEDTDLRGKKGESENDKKGDDEDDEKTTKRAVHAERQRCSRIIAHGISVGAVRQAGIFAFDTDMSAKTAIAAIDASRADAPRSRNLADRMAGVATPNPGSGATGAQLTVAEQIVLAGKKRRGEKI